MKKSKSVALDSRDLNLFFSMMKGYGPLMALGVIAVLSVCAAFFIYRANKGQSKRNAEKSVMETEEKETTNPILKKRRVQNKHVESTGNMDDSQKTIPTDPCEMMQVVYPLKSSHISTEAHGQNLKEGGKTSSESCASVQGVPHESLADYTTAPNESCASQTGSHDLIEQLEAEDAGEQRKVEVQSDEGLIAGQSSKESQEGFVEDGQMHTFVNESWEDLSGCFGKVCLKMSPRDLHEKEISVKSSALNMSCLIKDAYENGDSEKSCRPQDQSCSSAGTVEHDFAYYQQRGPDSPPEQLVSDNFLEEKIKTEDDLTWALQTCITSKGPEELMVIHQYDQEMPLLNLYKSDYLSFSAEGIPEMTGESAVMKNVDVSPVAPSQSQSSGDVQVEENSDKTEINIMEATMDNNEWLNGNEALSDFPWISLSEGGESSSMAEGSQQDIDWDTEKSETSEALSAAFTTSNDNHDDDPAMKRVATVPPMPQTVRVTFSVHYITDTPNQLLAVTGNQQELGAWRSFLPLQRSKHGLWSESLTLPVESQVEWKFVLVEDGEIFRWEECSNRHLVLTGQDDDLHVQRWWGCL
ncbi:uncharacterized protein stbd1 [Clupea harengus]|uniref:Starch-binding domain-containing protein 1 n=1 Tax=Clupea harengus TaxID=7950 RepID=A0A6P3W1C3_CLUHA|nr:uncharacterized protein stbd1 [Clupea harengus]